jgi:hypothetical protein
VARLPLKWAKAGRTREGELFRRVCRELVAHVGGEPNRAQFMLLQRIAWVQVHLARIDERAIADGGLSPHATREYIAWSRSIAGMLVKLEQLGAQQAQPRGPTLADYLATRARAEPPSAA